MIKINNAEWAPAEWIVHVRDVYDYRQAPALWTHTEVYVIHQGNPIITKVLNGDQIVQAIREEKNAKAASV